MTGQRDFSLIVAFGTDMGNSEDAAMTFAEAVEAVGIEASAIELNQVELADLQSATHFIVVCSTFGEGEFPDNALLFWESISPATDRLEHLSFAVLALGDTSYELLGFVQSGTLTRLDLAFSRDRAEAGPKEYVQQRMWENSAEFFGWLQDGAHVYVCGDAERMAKDVDATLHDIVAGCGGMDTAAAHAYVSELIKNHRYVRDVY